MSWLKMRTNLLTDPRVVQVSIAVNKDRVWCVGACYVLWCLADAHSTDGKLRGYTPAIVDELVGYRGFSAALVSVGWLIESSDGVEIPRFDEHNSKSAKSRAQTASRVAKHRNANTVTSALPRTEKRREENNNINKTPADAVVISSEVSKWAETLSKRPDWLPDGKPWIDKGTWQQLAISHPNLNAATFNAIMSRAKQGRNTLENPAGYIISQIRTHSA